MKRFRYAAIVLLVVGALALCVWLAMPHIGSVLIRSDRLARADMIVVLGSYRAERTVEAGALFKEGWSGRILLLRSPGELSRPALRRLGIHLPVWIDVQKDVLEQMGVPSSAIVESPVELGTTREEAEYIGQEARRGGMSRVIVVTSPYHTRRAGSYIRRAAGPSVVVLMRANRYERADPDHWWQRPVDRNEVVFEYLKRIYGLVGS